MLKLLSKINAVSAVLDCWSMGCSGDEASDYCKITVLVINGLKKKKESKGPVATIQFSGLLPEARYLARPGLPHRTLIFVREIHFSSKK